MAENMRVEPFSADLMQTLEPQTFYGFFMEGVDPHISEAPQPWVLSAIIQGALHGHMYTDDGTVLAVLGAEAERLPRDIALATSDALNDFMTGGHFDGSYPEYSGPFQPASAATHLNNFYERAADAGMMPEGFNPLPQ